MKSIILYLFLACLVLLGATSGCSADGNAWHRFGRWLERLEESISSLRHYIPFGKQYINDAKGMFPCFVIFAYRQRRVALSLQKPVSSVHLLFEKT